jgi:uncharacterized protein
LPYPDPVPHCDICDWQRQCERQLRKDDHLSFVAGLGRLHTKELTTQGITTLASFAAAPVPLTFKPPAARLKTYERLREQARLQLQQRETASRHSNACRSSRHSDCALCRNRAPATCS